MGVKEVEADNQIEVECHQTEAVWHHRTEEECLLETCHQETCHQEEEEWAAVMPHQVTCLLATGHLAVREKPLAICSETKTHWAGERTRRQTSFDTYRYTHFADYS